MKYRLYLRVFVPDNGWANVGENHEILWDQRDLIKASSGWLIVNQEKIGVASEIIPKLHKGILELENSPESYTAFELSLGLGTIKIILKFYKKLLMDCQQFPYAELCGHISG